MGELSELYRDWNQHKKEVKENNFLKNVKYLQDNKLEFELNFSNSTCHIRRGNFLRVDYYPTTNKWIDLNNKNKLYKGNVISFVNWYNKRLSLNKE